MVEDNNTELIIKRLQEKTNDFLNKKCSRCLHFFTQYETSTEYKGLKPLCNKCKTEIIEQGL